MIRVKICGITNVADARQALESGADALGLIFAKSPRRVSLAAAKKITAELGPMTTVIGVFVDEAPEKMVRTAKACGFGAVQLHGRESAATVKTLQKNGLRVIKAVRVEAGSDLKKVRSLSADALLFDTAHAGKFGGTGRSFDWSRLKGLKTKTPCIVSGGLGPKNVKKLLSVYRPYAVDASSGVEKAPGRKSAKLVKEFIRNAKSTR